MTDFNGNFKISPYFVKRYPTLARILQDYLPLLKDNPQIKKAWIQTTGYKDFAEGEKAFNQMVTYGEGPWITPTREQMFVVSLLIMHESALWGPFKNGITEGDDNADKNLNAFNEKIVVDYYSKELGNMEVLHLACQSIISIRTAITGKMLDLYWEDI